MALAYLAGLGGQEILIIAVVALIIFGGTRVPQFMAGLGKGIKEFKNAVKDDPEDAPPSKRTDSELPARPIGSDKDDQDKTGGSSSNAA